ncbi:MAG: T9SS type A sorting domain-containing protein [Bacteroidetes bacterium]|nr:T9SS type A sorting domain-containing protein [Bacteroidota bacterium]
MKKIIQFIAALFLISCLNYGDQKVFGQNLVPNPSFEDTLNCNGPWNCNCYLEIAIPWFNPNIETSDIFTPFPLCGYSTNSGMQLPRTGNVYAGFFGQLGETREYLEIPLFDSLLANQWYCIGFYFSKSDFCSGAIDRIGAYLSHDSLISTNPYHFAVNPQVESPQGALLTDTINWILVSGLYKAIGGEKFLTIGNFRDTASTLYQNVDSSNILCNHAYYLIDDVVVTACDSLTSHSNLENGTNGILISYNQDNLHIYLGNKLGRQGLIKIFDVSGKLIKECSIDSKTDSLIISKSQFKSQIYFIQYIDTNGTYSKKILILN